MTTEKIANASRTTLNGALDNATTTVNVIDASTFPSSGNFRIIVNSEIMLVTAVSSNAFTVTRGVETTTAAPHVNGATVTHILTAASLTQFIADYAASNADHFVVTVADSDLTNKVLRNQLANYSADNAPSSPQAANDEFNTGSLSGSWTSDGSPDTLSASTYLGYLQIIDDDAVEAGAYETFTPGAAAFTVAAKFTYTIQGNFSYFGIVLKTSGASSLAAATLQATGSVMRWRYDAAGGTVVLADAAQSYVGTVYIALQRDSGSGYTIFGSWDGMNWQSVGTFTSAGTVGRIYLVVNGQSATQSRVCVDFVRVFTSQTTTIGNT